MLEMILCSGLSTTEPKQRKKFIGRLLLLQKEQRETKADKITLSLIIEPLVITNMASHLHF